MAFTRRFGFFPGTDVIMAIEGVSIIDLPPPGLLSASGTGTVCIVGEYPDVGSCTAPDGSGLCVNTPKPIEVFSPQDMLGKVGGFDATIGEFGKSGGNAFAMLRGRTFARLLCSVVSLASAEGARLTRVLPLCRSAADPSPGVFMQAATVSAGVEFRSGAGRMRTAQTFSFTALAILASAINGATVVGASAVVQTFSAPGFDWSTISRPDGSVGAHKGDILVVGQSLSGAKYPTLEAGTYRVQVTPAAGTTIVVERMDGVAFAWTANAGVSWRLHQASDADTAPSHQVLGTGTDGYKYSENGGYVLPVRPLTSVSGASVDGVWTPSLVVAPVVAAAALTATTWAPLSGLQLLLSGLGVTYTNNVQRVNAPSSAALEALYAAAFDSTIADEFPTSDITILVTARTSTVIRAAQKANVIAASGQGVGRTTIITPALDTVSLTTVLADADPGVGVNRDERVDYCWPGARTYIPEAVGFSILGSDGIVYTDGQMDLPSSSWLASVLSILPPERNPGQAQAPVPGIMASVLGYQRGAPKMGLPEYSQLRARGVVALRMDRSQGPVFQSGVTTSLTSGQKNINRRRMADYIEDQLAQALAPFSKLPLSTSNQDAALTQLDAFLGALLSLENKALQRISGYQLDDKSGNTPAMTAAGIKVFIARVQLTPTGDFLVVQAEIGEGVVIVSST